jgi:hypothetical protein
MRFGAMSDSDSTFKVEAQRQRMRLHRALTVFSQEGKKVLGRWLLKS